jgi:hypothetical protein
MHLGRSHLALLVQCDAEVAANMALVSLEVVKIASLSAVTAIPID